MCTIKTIRSHTHKKQALNDRLILKQVHRVIKFNQKNMVKTLYWYDTRYDMILFILTSEQKQKMILRKTFSS